MKGGVERGVARGEVELSGVRDLSVVMSGKEEEEERWTGVILSGGGGGTGLCKASRSFSPSGNTRGEQGMTSGTDSSISKYLSQIIAKYLDKSSSNMDANSCQKWQYLDKSSSNMDANSCQKWQKKKKKKTC